MKLSQQYLQAEHWEFVSQYFVSEKGHSNSFFAHPENLLLSGLLSKFSSERVKEQSLKKILEARAFQRMSRAKKVRKFIPPYIKKINFDTNNIFDLLKWDKFEKNEITPPPLLQDLTDNELKSENLEKIIKEKIPGLFCLLCHSQHNER